MKKKSYSNLFFTALATIFFAFSSLSYAQNLASAQKTLARYQTNIDQLEKEAKQFQSSIIDAKALMIQNETKLEPFEKAMEAALNILRKARVEAATNASKETNAKVDNANFKFILAKRKFKRANRELANSRLEIKKLENKLKKNQSAIFESKASLEKQTSHIIDLKKKQQTTIKKTAVLHKQKKQEKIQKKEAPIKNTKPSSPQVAPAATVQSKTTTSTTKSTAKTKEPIATTKNEDKTAYEFPEPAQAVAQAITKAQKDYKEIQKRLGDLDLQNIRKRVTKVLHMKTQYKDKPPKATSHSLKFIGKKLYQATINIRAGINTFSVGKRHWQRTIPEAEDKAVYIITLDKMDPDKPKLIMFNQIYLQ